MRRGHEIFGLTLLLAAALFLPACKRKETTAANQAAAAAVAAAKNPSAAPTSQAANPVNPSAPESEQDKQRTAQAVAMRSGYVPPPPAMQLRGGEPATPEVLQAYNQQLTRLIFQRQDAPETLEQLRKWPMPRLPTPPPGKRIVYDARNRIIVLYPP